MTLYEKMYTECTMLDKQTVADGVGGFTTKWTDGAAFKAAIVKDTSTQAKIAEKSGVTELYTVTVPKGMPIEYHDIFRRESDGAIFRVTSNIKDSETPDVATFSFGQVSAEAWSIENA